MKKIDKLFVDFPELKIMEDCIRKTLLSKNQHPLKKLYRRYLIRKPKRYNECMNIIQNKERTLSEIVWVRFYLDHVYRGNILFNYLNLCFRKIKTKSRVSNIITNLKNPSQFYDTISEIEVNSYFSSRYELNLEPKINYTSNKYKKLDADVKLSSRWCYLEITTPKMSKELMTGKAVFLGNKSKNKILTKLDDQIKPIINEIRNPLVLVVNRSYSDLDEYDIEDSLLGQSQFTFFISDDTNNPIPEGYFSRDNNSLIDTHPYANIISAILVYKIILHTQGIEFRKSIVLNKKAKYPLNAEEYKRLNRFNLSNLMDT